MNKGLKIIATQQKEELTVEKLRKLMCEPELSEEDAKEIISGIDILVGIIIDFQAEQELKQKETTINLKQAA